MDRVQRCLAAAIATARDSRLPGPPDRSDREEAANWAAYQAWASNVADHEVEKLAVTITRRRMIDVVRGVHGRGSTVTFTEFHDYLTQRPGDNNTDLELESVIDSLAGGDRRTTRILWMLVDGHTKQAVAETIGVHPSRISQILRRVRSRAARGTLDV